MASFQPPLSRNIEQILGLLIHRKLLESGIDVERDPALLHRVRQQLPVVGFLDAIAQAGRRNAGGELQMIDISAGGNGVSEHRADEGDGMARERRPVRHGFLLRLCM